ncbi:MAG: FAD-dependent oxidoreductase [Acidimicrobiia bacterium]|jgi:NADPH-dependent glutamate synthase beta subunit-like oxidoreductase/NAD-dependent dihydropyrimidine dehydrogenase PreA subunit
MSWELSFYDQNIPCLAACPVHTNAGMYVAAIADGDDELAYLTARLPNPFASVCGRVCAAPCEDACRRGAIDRPIAIRALKRFVTEKYGTEVEGGDTWLQVAAPPEEERPQSIGIVGGGPAGLAAAHDLRRWGYEVTVYEATDKLGGAMWLGIPEYRLDRTVLQRDIDAIIDLGIDVEYETRMGEDVTFDQLRERHDALFLAIGATLGRGLDIEGNDADGVFRAIEFLINMNRGFQVDVGESVVVVGGGDVAMDAARTALRADEYAAASGQEEPDPADASSSMQVAFDVARTAARAGARDVTVVSLENRKEMPAHEFEIEEAEKEGIDFVHRRGPSRILTTGNNTVSGLETIACLSVFDDEGHFAPEFDTANTSILPADTVILAIGQAIDLDSLGADGPEISPRRTIAIDADTGRTSIEGIWSGGDAAKGPRTLIDAIADGRKSAEDIHRFFGGKVADATEGRMETVEGFHRLDDTYDRFDRVEVPTLDTGRRIGLSEVETGFTEEMARLEASRCLRCFANILLEVDKCVLCALCSDVCPVDVISLVPAEQVDVTAKGSTALLLDEERCIRCSLCVDRCPTDALSMGMWTGVGVPA